MIIDYPESKPSFEDLHQALPFTNLRKELIKSLKQVYETRILHPGRRCVCVCEQCTVRFNFSTRTELSKNYHTS